MNYAIFAQDIRDFTEKLVRTHGLSSAAAARNMRRLELGCMEDYYGEKNDSQLILDCGVYGISKVAEMRNVSRETVRKQKLAAIDRELARKVAA